MQHGICWRGTWWVRLFEFRQTGKKTIWHNTSSQHSTTQNNTTLHYQYGRGDLLVPKCTKTDTNGSKVIHKKKGFALKLFDLLLIYFRKSKKQVYVVNNSTIPLPTTMSEFFIWDD